MNAPISTILFDLDDTLNDRQLSWNKFVPLFQNEYADSLGTCDAMQISQAIANADRGGYRDKNEFFTELSQCLPWNSPPTAAELERFWRSCFAECMVERAGARALLMDLRKNGFKLGVVTNGRFDMQLAKIARLGFDRLVHVVIISETIGIKKPDPRILQSALEALGSKAESALFVGDHPVLDVAGAHRAGIRAAWLSLDRKWATADRPEYIISTLADLRDRLEF